MKDSREILRNPLHEADLIREFEPQVSPVGQYPSYRVSQTADGFQMVDYWRAVRKRLWLVIGIAVLITTLTAIYMARRPDVFQAEARVQVDLEQVNPDLVTSDRQRSVLNSDPAYINTQLQLLGSDGLIRRVIKEYNLDSNKEFQQTKADDSVSAWRSALRTLGLATDDAEKKAKSSSIDALQASLGTSEEVSDAIRLAPYVSAIKLNLVTEPIRESRTTVKDTRLIAIMFRHTDPDIAAFVVNAIAKTFTDANQEKRTGTNRKTNDFLQDRIASLESELKADENSLVDLTQRAGILKTEGDQTIVSDRLSGLNQDLRVAENDRKNAEAIYFSVANDPDKLKSLAEVEARQFITQQQSSLNSLQIDVVKKIADLKQARTLRLQEFLETAPEITEIDVQIASYQGSLAAALTKSKEDIEAFNQRTSKVLLDNLRTKYLQTKEKENKVRVDFDKQFGEAQGQNQGAVSIKLLQQNIESKKGFLENLRRQVSGNDVASSGSDNNISVSEIAIPPKVAVSPRRLTTVLAALFLSTLFGIGLALVLEYLDDTIRTTEEIENYLQLPALAAIPSIDSLPKRKLLLVGATESEDENPQSPLLISADSRSSLAEAYRHLRTSILLSTAGHAPKSLLVSSSLPSEGKSTIATNTAISLAQTGAKVLIIDADMRRPRLHSIFSMENEAGLSSLLASEITDDEITNSIKYDERGKLFVMTSGPIPPNPAELIGSKQMVSLLGLLQARFTHIVIDSPPIASFTDGVLIASMVDGVILVVHAGRSSRQVVKRSRQMLQEIGAKIFGVVLNNVNLNNKDNYYYYQSYYHRNNYTDRGED